LLFSRNTSLIFCFYYWTLASTHIIIMTQLFGFCSTILKNCFLVFHKKGRKNKKFRVWKKYYRIEEGESSHSFARCIISSSKWWWLKQM